MSTATMETLKSALPAIFDTYTYDMSNREGEAFTCYGKQCSLSTQGVGCAL